MKLGMERSGPEEADGQENVRQSAEEGSKKCDQQEWSTGQKVGTVVLTPFKSW